MRKDESLLLDYHTKQINSTFDYFDDFMNHNQIKKTFDLKTCIDNAIDILQPLLNNNHIFIHNLCDNLNIFTNESEMTLALLNILNNSLFELTKDKTLKERYIFIESKLSEDNSFELSIQDTRKLIPLISHTIFEHYNSTKEERNSLDMRLVIAKKLIEESFQGKLTVQMEHLLLDNKKINSCKFTIKLNQNVL